MDKSSTGQIITPALTVLLLCILTSGCSQSEPAAPSIIRGEIREIINDQAHSWNAGDIEEFMSAYWRSGRLSFNADGKVERGFERTLNRYHMRYPDRETMGHLKLDNLEINELGDDAAYVLGRWYIRRENPVGGTFTLILQKKDDEWRIVHDHTSTVEQEED